MSDFAGNEDLLRDFLTEATELLCGLDNRLIALEKSPEDSAQLNAVFRDFHTIKGGAGFLGATELVKLCHLTENLFDRLRNGKMRLGQALMDTIFATTNEVRRMFGELNASRQPTAAAAPLLSALETAITGEAHCVYDPALVQSTAGAAAVAQEGPDWSALLRSIATAEVGSATPLQLPPATPSPAKGAATAAGARLNHGRRATDHPGVDCTCAGRRASDPILVTHDTTIRIDTARLDHVLGLTSEIGRAKNRLNGLRAQLRAGNHDVDTLQALDESIARLDLLVSDLQHAVMRTRMQPVGRLFQRYPRLVRDLARELGKQVELQLQGEDIELDRMMIEELSDPLMHLLRNAVDHGVETPVERKAHRKPARASIMLAAQRSGDHIVVTIADDGRGMRADALRRKAIEKGLLAPAIVNVMDDRRALQLILLPGLSTKDQVSSISGRGVGMDVVKTNVQRLNGRIEIASTEGSGTTIRIDLPLTPAIAPALVVPA